MKTKLLFASLMAGLALAIAGVGHVGATQNDYEEWTFYVSGSGSCQENGSYKINWTVENPNKKYLKIHQSSNEDVVPAGTQVPKNDSANFEQTVDGTQPGTYDLQLKGNWPEGQTKKVTVDASVTLNEACPQPGRGAEVVTTTPAPQVTVPVKAVSAGSGGARAAKLGALLGLTGSLGVLAFGVRRLAKNQ